MHHFLSHRFLLLCSNNRLPSLRSLALDTLANLAPYTTLPPYTSHTAEILLGTVYECIQSQDKAHVLKGEVDGGQQHSQPLATRVSSRIKIGGGGGRYAHYKNKMLVMPTFVDHTPYYVYMLVQTCTNVMMSFWRGEAEHFGRKVHPCPPPH